MDVDVERTIVKCCFYDCHARAGMQRHYLPQKVSHLECPSDCTADFAPMTALNMAEE